jgi:hypothetical protein
MTIGRPILLLALSVALPCSASGPQGVRFNSVGVLDLAQQARSLNASAVPVTPLDAGAARQILAAPALDQEHATLPFSDYLFGCAAESKTCVPQHEQQLITTSSGIVLREKKRLVIKPADAPAVVFVDWLEPTTKTADGDSETHWYLGTLAGSGLHQVEVQFGHDAPGSFLINPKNGKTAFVHSGSDIVALSPDGLRLVTFNADNSPLTLRVAVLDAAGPRLELECTAGNDDRSTAQFKGWHGIAAFDLVLATGSQGKAASPLATTFKRAADGWQMAASDAALASRLGFACRTAPISH